jgi:signal transduction histidine kinase
MPPRRAPVHSGLRLQIVLALAGLMILAFVPLFFAVASLTRITLLSAKEQSALALGRVVVAHVADALAGGGPEAFDRALRDRAAAEGVEGLCVFGEDGARLACAGDTAHLGAIRPPETAGVERSNFVHEGSRRLLEIASPHGGETIVLRMRIEGDTDRGTPLVRLVALYMSVFALALLVFAYFALTRVIVRPVDRLVAAADRVASGARTLQMPRSGARELVELSRSVQAMAERLIAEEATLLLKVDELTETTRRLTQTQEQLVRSERLASVGRLAAGVAHEIGNPIAALMGIEEILLEGGIPREQEHDFLERMRRETQRIHSVVRDLLDFARPEGKVDDAGGTAAPADVRTALDDVVALVRPQKYFRGIRFETQVEAATRVALPSAQLTQVLLNMVVNAGAAIAGQGRDDGCVTVRAKTLDDRRVRIEVEDDGPGLAPQVRDRVFEPFVTTKEVGEGTGLGLAVCRGLVEAAGGEIGVDRSYERGARFFVVLLRG